MRKETKRKGTRK